MNAKEWAECVLVLRAAYGASFKLDSPGIKVWYEQLNDLSGEAVQRACSELIKTKPAFPTIADIRRLAEPQIDNSTAWKQACDYVSILSLGPLSRGGVIVPFPEIDPRIQRAIDSVGREAIRMRTPDNEGTLRAHFMRFFAESQQRQRMQQAGLFELSDNNQMGISAR